MGNHYHGDGRPNIRKRALITVTAMAVVSAGAVGATRLAGFGRGSGFDPTSVAGIHLGLIDTVNLTSTSPTRADLPPRATKHRFTTVGVTWNEAATQLNGAVQVRTRSVDTGQWSGWQSLAREDSAPAGQATRGGTAPMWVGLSDGVQVRVRAADGSASLPSGLNIALVDPNDSNDPNDPNTSLAAYQAPADTPTDTASPAGSPTDTATATPADTPTDSASPTDSATPSDSASPSGTASPTASASASASTSTSPSASPSPSPTPTAASELPTVAQAYPAGCPGTPASHPLPNPLPANTTSTIPEPPIVTRAGWKADECVRKAGYPAYGQAAKVVFVHHTDDPNTYTCADSPALVRAAYLYHVQTEGWDDIGYNFLVDKCGTIFEGRFGGVALPITGAQTYGFNTNSTGIAAIGTYTDASGGDASSSPNAGATPTDAMLRSIAWIAAWKLGMYSLNPVSGTSVLPEGGTEPVSEQKYANGAQVTFKVISGHRDGWNTDCPGDQLYGDLAQIRTYAGNPASFEHPVTKLDGGAVQYKNEWVTRSAATVHWATPSTGSAVSGYEVLVDGASVATAASTASSAAITLSGSGTHQVAVQTDYASGSPEKSAPVPVVVDTTAPTFAAAPQPLLRTGATASATSVPVTVSWGAAKDNTALAAGGVTATSPSAATFASTATSWTTTARPGTSNLYALKATDIVGNAGTASASRTPSIVLPATSTRTGTWVKHTSSAWLGGYAYFASTAGASITFTITGKSFALIATRASSEGGAYVYVDGKKIAGINLNNKTTLYRQTVWQGHAAGKHTVKIVDAGSGGHPAIAIEGMAVLN